VRIRWTAAAVLTMPAVLASAGCSSSPPDYHPAPGTLVAGTAQVTVDGQDGGLTRSVQCNATGPLTTITNQEDLIAESVGIRDVAGFTGSYNQGLGGTATVTMTGRTYHISGTADGFRTGNPSFRTSGTFAVQVSC
jgi:hypothetical protein